MRQSHALRKATSVGLKAAVHRAKAMSRAGALERMFTFTFSNLVYPQIWEDPIVDMRALEIGRGHEVIAIASGGCNVLSYLLDDPGRVTAVDLNGAHVALGRGYAILAVARRPGDGERRGQFVPSLKNLNPNSSITI